MTSLHAACDAGHADVVEVQCMVHGRAAWEKYSAWHADVVKGTTLPAHAMVTTPPPTYSYFSSAVLLSMPRRYRRFSWSMNALSA